MNQPYNMLVYLSRDDKPSIAFNSGMKRWYIIYLPRDDKLFIPGWNDGQVINSFFFRDDKSVHFYEGPPELNLHFPLLVGWGVPLRVDQNQLYNNNVTGFFLLHQKNPSLIEPRQDPPCRQRRSRRTCCFLRKKQGTQWMVYLASLKATYNLNKWMVGKMIFLLGRPIFNCYVNFRERVVSQQYPNLKALLKMMIFLFPAVGYVCSVEGIYAKSRLSGLESQFCIPTVTFWYLG